MTRAFVALSLLSLLCLLGCPPAESGASASLAPAKPGPIDAASGPYTETVVRAVKKGKPTILVDMLPEAQRLVGFEPAAQQAYLRRRAVMLAQAGAAEEESFAGKSEYVVRMILLKSLDEYGNPQWAGAPELAKLELRLPAEQADVHALDTSALEALFQGASFDLSSIQPALEARQQPSDQPAASEPR